MRAALGWTGLAGKSSSHAARVILHAASLFMIGTPASAFELRTSGSCTTPIRSRADCTSAATALLLSDRTAEDWSLQTFNEPVQQFLFPPYCYFDWLRGSVFFSVSQPMSDRECSVHYKCLCHSPASLYDPPPPPPQPPSTPPLPPSPPLAPGQHIVRPGDGTLQIALNNSQPGDELVLADGVFTGTDASNVVGVSGHQHVLIITKSITIRAQTAGQAIIDAQGFTDSNDNGRRCIYIGPPSSPPPTPGASFGARVVLDGLVITGGREKLKGGGGLYIEGKDAQVTISNTDIHSNYGLHGGGVLISDGNVTLDSCRIFANSCGGAGGESNGGGVSVSEFDGENGYDAEKGRPTVLLNNCSIYGNAAGMSGGGVGVAALGSTVFDSLTSVTITSSEIHSNWAKHGAGVYMSSQNTRMTIDSTSIHSNAALVVLCGNPACDTISTAEGGGFYGASGNVIVSGDTILNDNTAGHVNATYPKGAGVGANLVVPGSIMYFRFPIRAGHWLPNSKCLVYRLPCDLIDSACQTNVQACSLNGTKEPNTVAQNTVSGPPYCQKASFIQPCDWESDQTLLGQTLYTPPSGIPVDDTFPYPCAAGMLGSAIEQDQLSALCKSPCPAGYVCPSMATTQPLPCTSGHYCPEGSTTPIPCPAGTMKTQGVGVVMTKKEDCATCPEGTFCSIGSDTATPCAAGTFNAQKKQSQCPKCEAGSYQDAEGATACRPCVRGSYCKAGSTTPVPCPGGTWNNQTGRSSEGSCLLVPVGSWAPIGSSVPESCEGLSGFYCPGAAADTVMDPPGSKPIIQQTGGLTRQEEVPAVVKSMQLGMSVDDFAAQRQAVEGELAQQYGVNTSQISLELAAGSVLITVTIVASPVSADPSSSSNISEVLERVRAIDDATLSAALSAALQATLNATITVTSTSAPELQTVSRTVNFVCPIGHWCTAGSMVPCPVNTYNNETGHDLAKACHECPDNSISPLASTSIDNCVCDGEHYDSIAGPGVLCLRCPIGTACHSRGTTIYSIPLKIGYYRHSKEWVDVRRCPDANANCGSAPECKESNSGCRGGNDTAAQCSEGLTGVFCMECDRTGLTERVYYSAGTDAQMASCKACGDTLALTIGLGALVLIVLAAAAALIHHIWTQRLSETTRGLLGETWKSFSLGTKVKILIAYYLIATKIDSVYEVRLPANVLALLDFFRISVTLGVAEVSTPLECLGFHGYLNELLFWMIAPLIVVGIIVLLAVGIMLYQGQWNMALLKEMALPSILRMLFILYPLVTNVAFDAFPCYKFDDGASYLKVDVSIRCESEQHIEATGVAWVAVLLYPIGLVVLNASLLFCAREAIISQRPTSLSRAIAFLHSEYEPHVFWWELVEMLRRFILVGLMVVIHNGSMVQLVLGSIFSAILFFFQMQAAPYVQLSNDQLASLCSFSLVVVFLCCVCFKYVTLTDSPEVRRLMNTQQENTYLFDTSILTVIIAICIVGALAASTVLFLIQLARERVRMRHEENARKARRLRLLKSGNEAKLHELPRRPDDPRYTAGPFHIFLSHNWAQGQSEMRIIKTRLSEMLPGVSVFLDVDNLGGGSDHAHVDVSSAMLCFCTKRFFASRPCARELMRATLRKLPTFALLETDSSDAKGGLSEAECRTILRDPAYLEKHGDVIEGFRREWNDPNLLMPRAEELEGCLFSQTPIVWYRLADFQDVTMRLIAERLLPNGAVEYNTQYVQTAYMQGEIVERIRREPIHLPPLPGDCTFHFYCSQHTPGARAICEELRTFAPGLTFTEDPSDLAKCKHFLVHLTSETWSSTEASVAFADELDEAMRIGVHRYLVHEVPGARVGDREVRKACAFDEFFRETSTPDHFIKAGLYSEIAMNLGGDEWRACGLAKFAENLQNSDERGDWVRRLHARRPAPQLSRARSSKRWLALRMGRKIETRKVLPAE